MIYMVSLGTVVVPLAERAVKYVGRLWTYALVVLKSISIPHCLQFCNLWTFLWKEEGYLTKTLKTLIIDISQWQFGNPLVKIFILIHNLKPNSLNKAMRDRCAFVPQPTRPSVCLILPPEVPVQPMAIISYTTCCRHRFKAYSNSFSKWIQRFSMEHILAPWKLGS